MSSSSSIHGDLEVTVVGCTKLMETEMISRQDPYVCLEYGDTKHRTRTCIDGGKNPTFLDRLVFTLVEGHGELQVVVWNSNNTTHDDFIGGGKYAGEVILVLRHANAANGQAASSHDASKTLSKSPVLPYNYSAPSSSHTPPPSPPAYATSLPPPAAWPAFYSPHATPYPYLPPPYPPTATYPPPPPLYAPTATYPPPLQLYPATATYPPPPQLYPPTATYPPPPQLNPPTATYPPLQYLQQVASLFRLALDISQFIELEQ